MTPFFLDKLFLFLSAPSWCPQQLRFLSTSDSYSQAEFLVRQGQWEQGIALLKQLLQTEPENLKAHNLLGIALTEKGDLVAANREFEHAARIDPHFSPALKNFAINEFGQKNTKGAERHFSQALDLAPNDPVIHAYLGHIAYSRQQYRKAATHLEKAGNLTHDPAVATELAESFIEMGQQQHAFDLLSQLDQKSLCRGSGSVLGLHWRTTNSTIGPSPTFKR